VPRHLQLIGPKLPIQQVDFHGNVQRGHALSETICYVEHALMRSHAGESQGEAAMSSTHISCGKRMKGGGARLGLTPANHVRIRLGHFSIKGLLVKIDDHRESTPPRALSNPLGQDVVACRFDEAVVPALLIELFA
jgi:hypothetical protein